MKRVWALIVEHVELLFALAIVVLLWRIFSEQAWRGESVVEVWPIIIDYLIGMLAMVLVGYGTWWFRRTYWHDLSADDEARLHDAAEHGDKEFSQAC